MLDIVHTIIKQINLCTVICSTFKKGSIIYSEAIYSTALIVAYS